MSTKQYVTFSVGDVFSIKMVGNRDFVLDAINTLVLDFAEPKFGYNGELYDEEEVGCELEMEFA